MTGSVNEQKKFDWEGSVLVGRHPRYENRGWLSFHFQVCCPIPVQPCRMRSVIEVRLHIRIPGHPQPGQAWNFKCSQDFVRKESLNVVLA